jgi:serine protease Do
MVLHGLRSKGYFLKSAHLHLNIFMAKSSIDPPPSQHRRSRNWRYWCVRLLPMLYISALTVCLPAIVSYRPSQLGELGAQETDTSQQQMRSVAIEILARGESIGSGILLSVNDGAYTVVTNAHVLQSATAPFQVRTPDRQIYTAVYIPPVASSDRDLAVLRFQSNERTYPTAKIAATKAQTGDRVWAVGFPFTKAANKAATEGGDTDAWGLKIASGNITHLLPKPLAGGYTIGTDSAVEKGMSGGPLFNDRGEVIGIDGVHADPLWEAEDTFADGTQVDKKLQSQIDKSSWAIAIDAVDLYLPRSAK